MANDFEKTDAQIHADLEAHAEQVDQEDEPRLAPTGTGGHRHLGRRQLIPPSKARTEPVIIRAAGEAR